MIDLDEIERRANAATPSQEWDCGMEQSDSGECGEYSEYVRWFCAGPHRETEDAARNDAIFIASARTDVPALVARVRELEAECERQSTLAAKTFNALIANDIAQMRAYGLSYEGVRQVLREHDDGEISFGKLMDLIRAAARAMAEDASSVHPSSLTDVVTALEDDLRIERENVAELEERLVLCQRTNDRMREKIGVKPPPWRTKTEGFEDPGEGVVTAGDLIGLRRKK